jgi:predicted dehydrogenase
VSLPKIKVAVAGLGWWGPKLLRNFRNHPSVKAVIGCDTDKARRDSIGAEFHVETAADAGDTIQDPSIGAIVVATPPPTHYEVAKAALLNGKHVLLTKPPTGTLAELEDLVRISLEKGVVLMLDSAFVFSSEAKKMKSMLEEGVCSPPRSVYSFRHGNDLHFHHIERLQNTMFKNGVDVVEDLLFHDLALVSYLFEEKIRPISIRRLHNLDPVLCDTTFIELESEHFPIHLSLSWTLPERKRQFLLFSQDRYLLFDDLRENGKLRLFEFGTKTEEEIPYERREPLAAEIDQFVQSILLGNNPLTDGKFMIRVMNLYEKVRHAKA